MSKEIENELEETKGLMEDGLNHIEVAYAQFVQHGLSGRVKVEIIWRDGRIVKVNKDVNESKESKYARQKS